MRLESGRYTIPEDFDIVPYLSPAWSANVNEPARITTDFRSWILGWGDEVEVIEPAELRDEIIRINQSVRNMYEE